jgi:hypothetical protein
MMIRCHLKVNLFLKLVLLTTTADACDGLDEQARVLHLALYQGPKLFKQVSEVLGFFLGLR